jgi:hypothetical protein
VVRVATADELDAAETRARFLTAVHALRQVERAIVTAAS